MNNRCIASPSCYFGSETANSSSNSGVSNCANILRSQALGCKEEKGIDTNRMFIPDTVDNEFQDNSAGRIVAVSTSSIYGVQTGMVTVGFNSQTLRYIDALDRMQALYREQTRMYMNKVYANNDNPSASALRNHGNWSKVKQLVVRDELMKLQIGDTTELPLTDTQLNELKQIVASRDLADFTDQELNEIIENVLKPDDKAIMVALKDFKDNGTVSPLLQKGKLDELREVLKNIDLDHISRDEYKRILENYLERIEIHHRKSISSDPGKQSDIDNLDALKTSDHDQKHTHIDKDGNSKIDYKKPVNEPSRNRIKELKVLNKKRVINNEIRGLAAAVLIVTGVGFAISFAVGIAQSGLNPETLKNSFILGVKGGTEAGAISGVSYFISRTAGTNLCENLTSLITEKCGETIATETLSNISKMCSMGVVGMLSVMVASVYQFTKLKLNGYSTKESLIRTGKSAALSMSVVVIAVVAQGVWGGAAGIVVSVSAAVALTGLNIYSTVHNRELRERIAHYAIEMCMPTEFGIA